MSPVSLLRRRAFLGSLISIVCVLPASLTAGQFWPFGRDKNTSYQTFKDPAGRFELEYPTKDWRLLSSVGSSLAVFSHKDGRPALVIDRVSLAGRLTPEEIDALPGNEVERLRDQQPKIKDFKSDVVETKAGRGVLIRYARVDLEPESVVQYTIAVGQDLYRLNGVVTDKLLSKYEPVIMHMIQSFKAPAGPSASKN